MYVCWSNFQCSVIIIVVLTVVWYFTQLDQKKEATRLLAMLLKAFRKLSKSKLDFILCILFVIDLVYICLILCKSRHVVSACCSTMRNQHHRVFWLERKWPDWPRSSHEATGDNTSVVCLAVIKQGSDVKYLVRMSLQGLHLIKCVVQGNQLSCFCNSVSSDS